MSESVFSPSWYRVAALVPRLRAHGEIHRHRYRKEIWYVLQDHVTGRSLRFTPEAYRIIGAMDGNTSVEALWERAFELLGDSAPTQDETIRVLGQLHAANMLLCDVTPDALELFERFERNRSRELTQRFTHPLSIRVPLIDPDRWLAKAVPYVQHAFGWSGFLVWLLVVATAAVLAIQNWPALTSDVADRVLAPQNLALVWIVYPFVKLLHELGHGFAAKTWGGEIHEMGVLFLIFVPVPYVEASSASAFPSKRRRMVVSAAGIMAELFLASVALLVWLNVESGLVSAVAYNVMLIGGISTLFFNGNPLLRFDGYYVLADLLEIPNLSGRSTAYLGYLVQRYAFRSPHARSPVHAHGERPWLFVYGVASFFYRIVIVTTIVLVVASRFFFFGALLAVWAAFTQVVLPVFKSLKFVLVSPSLARSRRRAVGVTCAAVVIAAIALFAVPYPLRTAASGVVWLPEQAELRVQTDGFVAEITAVDGAMVSAGEPLIRLQDEFITTQLALDTARLRELEARFAEIQFDDRGTAAVLRQRIASVSADIGLAQERLEALVVRAPGDGVFVLPRRADLVGQYLRRGDLFGYVIGQNDARIRTAVEQDAIGLMRDGVERVELYGIGAGDRPSESAMLREVPGGSFTLPSVALGTNGGGRIAVDPSDPRSVRTLERVFQFDLLAGEDVRSFPGRHVNVVFHHGYEPLGWQGVRALRQLFLRRFGV